MAIKRLCGHLCSTKFLIYFGDKAHENNTKTGEHNAHVQRGLEFLSAYSYTLEYRKGWFNGNADFFSHLPQPATDIDRTGPNYLISTDTVCTHLIQAFDFTAIEPFTPGFGLGGFLSPASSRFNPIPPFPGTKNDFGDYRRLGPRMDTSNSAQVTLLFVAAIAAPKPAARSLHSLRLCPRLVQPPAAGSPHTFPVGLHFAQDPTTDSARRVFVFQRCDQIPTAASPHGVPAGHFVDQDQDPAAASPHGVPTGHGLVQDLSVN